MPCPFTGHKMFCAGPNFLSLPKNLTAFKPKPFKQQFSTSNMFSYLKDENVYKGNQKHNF